MSTLTAVAVALVLATATPGPSGPEVAPRGEDQATSFPVESLSMLAEPLTMPAEPLIWSTASLDGAVTDTGDSAFRLNADVLFAFDKAELTPRARTEITRIAGVLSKRAGGLPATVDVTGFTDATGSDSYNLDLSRRRAEAVRGALAPALGGTQVRAAGRGEAEPIADNESKPGQALNRRVEIRVG